MRSSSNHYYIGLDQLRAVAAFLVFSWHFINANNSDVINNSYSIDIPFIAFLLEGHVGVSLFMVLSGYLFARLLDNREINYRRFYLNRILRLAPLMIFVVFVNAIIRHYDGEESVYYFFASLASGLVKPSLPNGGWSITVEFHFYLLIPLLLWMRSRSALLLVVFIFSFIILRFIFFAETGSIRHLTYWTIFGRIDLFILGILAFHFREKILAHPSTFWISLCLFALIYWQFEVAGGYKDTRFHPLWTHWAAIEGLFLGIIVVGYDSLSSNFASTWSKFVAMIGKVSYSMYLLHFFFVSKAPGFISEHIVPLDNILAVLFFNLLSFLAMVPIAYISYHLIEKPFLSLRVRYFLGRRLAKN